MKLMEIYDKVEDWATDGGWLRCIGYGFIKGCILGLVVHVLSIAIIYLIGTYVFKVDFVK